MLNSREQLGELVKAHRERMKLTQDELADKVQPKTNRSVVAHLEQGLRIPKPDVLENICTILGIPARYWEPFANDRSLQRFEFEEALAELVGYSASLDGHEEGTIQVAEALIAELFRNPGSVSQTLDRLNSVLTFYGVSSMTAEFFDNYFETTSFGSVKAFDLAIKRYQKDAVRLFSTFAEAYRAFNQPSVIKQLLSPIEPRSLAPYSARSEWNVITEIADDKLPDLGYISAARVKQQATERQALKRFLDDLAAKMKTKGKSALDDVPAKTRRRMDTLLRQFKSNIEHGLFSPLFAPDADELEREAARLAPKSDEDLQRMAQTQSIALQNLAHYLAADHLDVYVATSMRSDADFVSVNHFVRALFSHSSIRPLRLRHFNPTQSWIEDRIAKGLVEALMLKRADVTIYMAQKADTFGKDSEASVALGQGKPVIVYVPKLPLDGFDTELIFKKDRTELIKLLEPSDRDDIDETVDEQAIAGKIIVARLGKASDEELRDITASVWADFDLHNEVDRIDDLPLRAEYRAWLDAAVKKAPYAGNFALLRDHVINILVANAIRFEIRAKTFREIHPLALQVILSSGVLNGILVVRGVQQCADVLNALIENDLKLELQKDESNYRMVETITGSTIRVISRHRLLRHAFQSFYKRPATSRL
jgi:transcriptional regulator with XRE-family HTH domain